MQKKVNRDIEVLSDYEHVLKVPEIYVGSVEPTEEKIPIIESDKIVSKLKSFSVGMYKILDEVIDNAFDEAKRCYADSKPMKKITINVDTKTNKVEVQDSGRGFKNAKKKNPKTKVSNVETAMTQLRAGSNFKNDETDINLVGMHGIGVSCTNVLSSSFSITTINSNTKYSQDWNNFKSININIKKRDLKDSTGTTITFIPNKKVFKRQKWDFEIIRTKLIFRNFLKNNSILKDLQLKAYIDGKEINLDVDFLPVDTLSVSRHTSRINLQVFMWKKFPNSETVTFVNGAQCSGIHHRIIFEEINDRVFEYEKAHYFYEMLILLDLPPKYVKFGDQNKTKFVSTRNELSSILRFNLIAKEISKIKELPFFINTMEAILESMKKGEIKRLKKAKKNSKKKITDKYFPSTKKDTLFITEGGSAAGSILQERDPKIHAVYALRGKVKNVKTIDDLTENAEILDLINILDLDIETKGRNTNFKRIIIATDSDVDGHHIASLLINFFARWFKNIIVDRKLFILKTPLVSVGKNISRKYYYSLSEYGNERQKNNTRYLKGLGSLDLRDWKYIFNNLTLEQIIFDKHELKYLDIAFGKNANIRKRWLQR